jgi:hypothetical protein
VIRQENGSGKLDKEETKKAVKRHLEAQGKAPKAKKPAADLVWKGESIVIWPFKPAEESAENFIAWLTLALPAFAETKPVREAAAITA